MACVIVDADFDSILARRKNWRKVDGVYIAGVRPNPPACHQDVGDKLIVSYGYVLAFCPENVKERAVIRRQHRAGSPEQIERKRLARVDADRWRGIAYKFERIAKTMDRGYRHAGRPLTVVLTN